MRLLVLLTSSLAAGCAHGTPPMADHAGVYGGAWPLWRHVAYGPVELDLQPDGHFSVLGGNALDYRAGGFRHGAGWLELSGRWAQIGDGVVLRWGLWHARRFTAIWLDGEEILVPRPDRSICTMDTAEQGRMLQRRAEARPPGTTSLTEFCSPE